MLELQSSELLWIQDYEQFIIIIIIIVVVVVVIIVITISIIVIVVIIINYSRGETKPCHVT